LVIYNTAKIHAHNICSIYIPRKKEHTKQLAFGYIMSHIKKPHSEQERFLSVIRRKIAEAQQPLYENVAGAELLQLDYRVQRISRFGL